MAAAEPGAPPTFEPIGTVHNEVAVASDTGWGSVVSEIRLRPELSAGLAGLAEFSHVVVVFLMHQARFEAGDHLVRRPRDRVDMPQVGIFAQRARHRPNPIGVTTCAIVIERVETGSIFVRGLDAIDGTPVLDLKPHVPAFDAPNRPRVADWIGRLMTDYFT